MQLFSINRALSVTVLIKLALLLNLSSVQAEGGVASKINTPLPCILAGSGNLGHGNFQQRRPNCNDPLKSDSAITGSLAPTTNRDWEASVTNSSDRPLDISVTIEQFNLARNRIASSSHRYSLQPGQSRTRRFRPSMNTVGSALILNELQPGSSQGR